MTSKREPKVEQGRSEQPLEERARAQPDRRRQLTRLRESVPIGGSDLRWLLAIFATAVSGALVQKLWANAADNGVGLLFLFAASFLALTRFLVGRIAAGTQEMSSAIDRVERSIHLTPTALMEGGDVSPVALKVWTDESNRHQRRLAALRDGLPVRGQAQTIEFLRRLTAEATETIHAVDMMDVRRWFDDVQLCDYLTFQLGRVPGVAVERIRFVSEDDAKEDGYRDALASFAELHRAAGARLLLCPEADARRLDTSFFPSNGMLVIDRARIPACITGRPGPRGLVEAATVYFRNVGSMSTAIEDYSEVRKRIERDDLDSKIRDSLGLPPPLDLP